MIEEFKDIVIPGYEGLYQVSNLGRVRSIKRKIFVKPNVDPAGYWKVCLTNHNHKWRHKRIIIDIVNQENLFLKSIKEK